MKLSVTAKIDVVAIARIRRVVSIAFFILCSLRRVAPMQDLESCAFLLSTSVYYELKRLMSILIQKKYNKKNIIS